MIARDLIVGAVLAALKADTPVAQHVLHGELLDNLPEGADSAVAVDLDDTVIELPNTDMDGRLDCTTRMRVDCFRRNDTAGSDGKRPSSILQAAVHERIASVVQDDKDPGALCIMTFDLVRLTAERSVQDARRGVLTAVYQIAHRVSAATLEPLDN